MSARALSRFPVVMFMVTIFIDTFIQTIIQVIDTVMFFISYMCLCLCVICCVHLWLHVCCDKQRLWPQSPPRITAEQEVANRRVKEEAWEVRDEANRMAHTCALLKLSQAYKEKQKQEEARRIAWQPYEEQEMVKQSLKRLEQWKQKSPYPLYMG
jgi:hypothetical protein